MNDDKNLTVTGRTICSEPELQRIDPPHTAEGDAIRELLKAKQGQVINHANFSALEMRLASQMAAEGFIPPEGAEGQTVPAFDFEALRKAFEDRTNALKKTLQLAQKRAKKPRKPITETERRQRREKNKSAKAARRKSR